MDDLPPLCLELIARKLAADAADAGEAAQMAARLAHVSPEMARVVYDARVDPGCLEACRREVARDAEQRSIAEGVLSNPSPTSEASKASNAKTSKVQSTHKDMNANSELVIVPSRGVESTSNSKSYQSSQSIEVHVGPDGRGVARSVIEENGRRKERMFERLPSGEWHATQG